MVLLREQDKHFLASLYAAIAVILAWKGIWDGMYYLPFPPFTNENAVPFVSLFIGFAMLTFSGLIFREFDPLGGIQQAAKNTLDKVLQHPETPHFKIKYYDKKQKKHITINADRITKIENNALVMKHKKKRKELFIPIHRVQEVLYKGKRYWKL